VDTPCGAPAAPVKTLSRQGYVLPSRPELHQVNSRDVSDKKVVPEVLPVLMSACILLRIGISANEVGNL
jgi:hypothetical protein